MCRLTKHLLFMKHPKFKKSWQYNLKCVSWHIKMHIKHLKQTHTVNRNSQNQSLFVKVLGIWPAVHDCWWTRRMKKGLLIKHGLEVWKCKHLDWSLCTQCMLGDAAQSIFRLKQHTLPSLHHQQHYLIQQRAWSQTLFVPALEQASDEANRKQRHMVILVVFL